MAGADSDSDNTEVDGAWGQLVRSDGTVALFMCRYEETIGRLDTCSLVIKDAKVSSLHARVQRAGPWIEDCSSNGLWLDGIKIGRGNRRFLGPSAQLSFGARPASDVQHLRFNFVACSAGAPADTAAAANGSVQPGTVRGAAGCASCPSSAEIRGDANVTKPGPSLEAAPATAAAPTAPLSDAGVSSDNHITCGICQDVFYNAVALQPCLHSFCAGCASTWLKEKLECPQCRSTIKVVSRNHIVNSIVEDYLSRHPERRLPLEERQRLDAEDTIGSRRVTFSKRPRRDQPGSSGSDDDSADSSDELGEDEAGLTAILSLVYASAGAAPPAHLPPMAACAGCAAHKPAALMASLDRDCPTVLPSTALGNSFEREGLLRILQGKGSTVSQMLHECLGHVALGTMLMPVTTGGRGPIDTSADGAAPSGGGGPRPLGASALACDGCRSDALASLAYQYRRAIPRAELPSNLANREDCWYGHNCRTQKHKDSHAERLNHICEPTPRPSRARPRARPRPPPTNAAPPAAPPDPSTNREPVLVD